MSKAQVEKLYGKPYGTAKYSDGTQVWYYWTGMSTMYYRAGGVFSLVVGKNRAGLVPMKDYIIEVAFWPNGRVKLLTAASRYALTGRLQPPWFPIGNQMFRGTGLPRIRASDPW